MSESWIASKFEEHIEVAHATALLESEILAICECCVGALLRGGKILLAGNGGSAADAQHIAAEFTGRFETERRALPAIALTTDTSALTAIGNDYGFERIFSRQVQALGQGGDVLMVISTSGNSPNLLRAVEVAHEKGLQTIGLLGKNGGVLREVVSLSLIIPSGVTARIQEMHILIGHLICSYIDQKMSS
jgi:D-sedoheptulose 7-phosphate isomerase